MRVILAAAKLIALFNKYSPSERTGATGSIR